MSSISNLFLIDRLSTLMVFLIIFIGVNVARFSYNYLKGDIYFKKFFIILPIQIISLCLTAIANNIFVFLSAFIISNICISNLMQHNKNWIAAIESKKLALKTLLTANLFLFISFCLLYKLTGSCSISEIVVFQNFSDPLLHLAIFLLIVSAMIQSAIWPFHKWLISSLNSPLPVSAFMHAGIVNGGGFILARFSPLLINLPGFLDFIFVVGLITAIIGTCWKLIQTDVKRMLACSTMGQMGFMFCQCGLGIFASATAHIFLHGMFKAYLFFISNMAANERKFRNEIYITIPKIILAIISGFVGASFYLYTSYIGFRLNSYFVIISLIFILSMQTSMSLVKKIDIKNILFSLVVIAVLTSVYGSIFYYFDSSLVKSVATKTFNLGKIHYFAIFIFLIFWCAIFYIAHAKNRIKTPKWYKRIYVFALNASRPSVKTLTSNKNEYSYK